MKSNTPVETLIDDHRRLKLATVDVVIVWGAIEHNLAECLSAIVDRADAKLNEGNEAVAEHARLLSDFRADPVGAWQDKARALATRLLINPPLEGDRTPSK